MKFAVKRSKNASGLSHSVLQSRSAGIRAGSDLMHVHCPVGPARSRREKELGETHVPDARAALWF